MIEEAAAIVSIDVQEVDGFFYAASPDVPGLHVCGETVGEMMDSAILAVKELFRVNRHMDVKVMPVSADMASFPHVTWPVNKLVVQHLPS